MRRDSRLDSTLAESDGDSQEESEGEKRRYSFITDYVLTFVCIVNYNYV